MFEGGLEKGLLFSRGEHWKKSRGIISNLFHFGLLKEREHTMYEVVRREVKDLEGKDVDLFKLGCKIGGEIVVETLFGKDFTNIRFGSNTPLEETQLFINALNSESLRPLYLLRVLLFGRVKIDSKWLTKRQAQLRDQLLRIKSVGADYIHKQQKKKERGEVIPDFIEAYLKLNDDSYIDEIIQQLVIFLVAGQDTTG